MKREGRPKGGRGDDASEPDPDLGGVTEEKCRRCAAGSLSTAWRRESTAAAAADGGIDRPDLPHATLSTNDERRRRRRRHTHIYISKNEKRTNGRTCTYQL